MYRKDTLNIFKVQYFCADDLLNENETLMKIQRVDSVHVDRPIFHEVVLHEFSLMHAIVHPERIEKDYVLHDRVYEAEVAYFFLHPSLGMQKSRRGNFLK